MTAKAILIKNWFAYALVLLIASGACLGAKTGLGRVWNLD